LTKKEIIKELKKAQAKWTPCHDKDCDNKRGCVIANHYIEMIWNPTFKKLIKKIK